MTSLILCKFPLFSQHFWILGFGCTLFPPVYTEIDNWDFECCSKVDFPIFLMTKKIKKLEFSSFFRPCLVRDHLVDQSVLFTHFNLMQGEKIEAWFVSQPRRECFGVEFSLSICQQIPKKIYPLVRWTNC